MLKALKEGDEVLILEILGEPNNRKYYVELLECLTHELSKEVLIENKKLLGLWENLRNKLDGKGSYLLGIEVILGVEL